MAGIDAALIPAFETAFTAVWKRASHTLGEVTLHAIVDRVLYVAAEQYPFFSTLQFGHDGLHSKVFRERISTVSEADLEAGVRFALLEFITVLGSLTAEILTPALHAELARVAIEDPHP